MTSITERPAQRTTSVIAPVRNLLEETESIIRSIRNSDVERGAELLAQLALMVSDPEANKPATMALFYRDNAGGRDTLGTLFYGSNENGVDNGPIVAPSTSRVMNFAYRTALNSLHAALNHMIPSDDSSLAIKRDFWEDVKTHLAPGQAMDDGQASEVTIADLNTVLKASYGAGRIKKLTAYTDSPESLNYALFNPRTVENTKLEIRASFRLNGEEPPAGCLSLRTMIGIVHFI